MNKSNKIILIIIAIITIVLAIFGAIIVYSPTKNNEQESGEKVETKVSEVILDECTDEYEQMEDNVITTNSEQEKISPNCKITLTKYYKQCKDEINEYIQVPDVLVNYTREEFQKQYKDWEIKKFSSNQIVLYKEFEGECGEHYILKDEEGKIIIYKIAEDGTQLEYEKTDISTQYLPEKDKKSILVGLKINGKEKLNELIESFE